MKFRQELFFFLTMRASFSPEKIKNRVVRCRRVFEREQIEREVHHNEETNQQAFF
jgi:hypothetical protein